MARNDIMKPGMSPAAAGAMKGDREEIPAHGFDGYIFKPIDAAVLRRDIPEKLT